MVEHVIGNDGVVSPILTIGTNAKKPPEKVAFLHWGVEIDLRVTPSLANKCSITSLVAAQLKEHQRVVLTRNARR